MHRRYYNVLLASDPDVLCELLQVLRIDALAPLTAESALAVLANTLTMENYMSPLGREQNQLFALLNPYVCGPVRRQVHLVIRIVGEGLPDSLADGLTDELELEGAARQFKFWTDELVRIARVGDQQHALRHVPFAFRLVLSLPSSDVLPTILTDWDGSLQVQ